MKKVKIYLYITLILLILNFKDYVLCQDTLKTVEITFTGLVGTYLPSFARGFLDEYNEVLRGPKEDFMHNFSGSLQLGAQWNDHYRFTLKSAHIYARFVDDYFLETYKGSNLWRTFWEDIEVKSIPLLLNYEWYYFFDIYKSYLSIGTGLTYSEIRWQEDVQTPIKFDIRTGGKILNEFDLYPTINLGTGIQLNFDEKSIPKFIKGITFGTDFIYFIRSTEIFEALEKQIIPYPKELKGKKRVLPFMIGLNFGLVLNLENKQINRIFGKNKI